jgi:ABC-type branched-subunit amino acid transport system substrate-binding protein
LVMNQNVDFLTGVTSSAVALTVSTYAREAKKMFIIATSLGARVTEDYGHRYVFRLNSNSSAMARGLQLERLKNGEPRKHSLSTQTTSMDT